jgi:hypothetical protein
MDWLDVLVPSDETTFALVQKDSSSQLGKRMCSHGEVIEIHTEPPPDTGGTLTNGLLMSDSSHLYHFVVAGSTAKLTEHTRATLCGMVTGNFDYANSAGGTGHAVSVVGMFVPESLVRATRH